MRGTIWQVSIIVVNWNTADLTVACLRSLFSQPMPDDWIIETIVVDNASTDDSVARIQSEFPQVQLIENNENVGFARANNQGITASRCRYVLLLNSDTLIHPNALEALLNFMTEHPEAGACGARLLNADGTLQESCHPFPSLTREAWRLFHLDRLNPRSCYNMAAWDTSIPRPVDVLMGACLLVRRSVFEQVGLLDESYFMYSEEVDLCRRIREAGWPLYWVPQAVIIHYGGQSSRQDAAKMFLQLYQSKILYVRKHHGTTAAFKYKCIISLAAIVRIALSTLVFVEPAARRSAHLTQARNYQQLLAALPKY